MSSSIGQNLTFFCHQLVMKQGMTNNVGLTFSVGDTKICRTLKLVLNKTIKLN